MSKQTAVEWLVDQLFKQGYFDGNKPLSITNLDHLQHQAKAMEREQIIEAWDGGNYDYFYSKGSGKDFNDGSEYYKEVYKGDNK